MRARRIFSHGQTASPLAEVMWITLRDLLGDQHPGISLRDPTRFQKTFLFREGLERAPEPLADVDRGLIADELARSLNVCQRVANVAGAGRAVVRR